MSERIEIEELRREMEQDQFIFRYEWIAGLMQANIQNISRELAVEQNREVVKSFQSRMKSPESIFHKLAVRDLPTNLETARTALCDLIGMRIIVMFLDDVYKVEESLRSIPGLHLVRRKDYIEEPKENGYRSLHLIFKTEIRHNGVLQSELFEVQIRTMAMDCWSALDHQMVYKQQLKEVDKIKAELKQYSKEIAEMDLRMMELRDAIRIGGTIC